MGEIEAYVLRLHTHGIGGHGIGAEGRLRIQNNRNAKRNDDKA
jgi:hypothetical protein